MKVGILTIYGGSNFGNKLQNYALQQFLKMKELKLKQFDIQFHLVEKCEENKRNWNC